jgi:predicted GIY-YIG superfamily endonuclease
MPDSIGFTQDNFASQRESVPPIFKLGKSKVMQNWWVYIMEKREKLYVGITTDLPNRMRQHGAAKPLYQEGPLGKFEALKRERILKGWRREKKLALIKKASSTTK